MRRGPPRRRRELSTAARRKGSANPRQWSATADGKAAANIKGATTDLAALCTEVDDSIRKVGVLIDEINRKWPFARDMELKLP